MDYEPLSIGVNLISLLVTSGVALYARAKVAAQAKEADVRAFREDVDRRLDALILRLQRAESMAHAAPVHRVDETFDALNERLARVEQDARHAPSRDDLGRVHVRLDTLSEELREIKGEFHGARRTLDLIHQYLLNGSRAE